MRSLPVAEAPAPSSAPVDPIGGNRKSIRIQYNSRDQFKKAAKVFGLMDDFKVSLFASAKQADWCRYCFGSILILFVPNDSFLF